MVRVRKILCPTDFSEQSRRALGHATALAKWYGAEIEVLYVIPLVFPPPLPLPVAGTPASLDEAARGRLEDSLEELAGSVRNARIGVRTSIREGDPVEVILREAGTFGADLIVLGTHGSRGFERWVLGSVTEKVLRRALCPVLTVPAGETAAPGRELFGTVLCPVDFSTHSAAAVAFGLSLGRQARSRVVLLHVLDAHLLADPRALLHFNMPEFRSFLELDAKEQLLAMAPEEERRDLTVEDVVAIGTPWREIVRVASERDVASIVMGVRGRGALDLMIFGSTTSHVVRQAACPVLTVHAPAPDGGRVAAREAVTAAMI